MQTRITVLHLIDQFYAGHGGTEQHLLFLQRALPRSCLELHFAVLSGIRRCSPAIFPVTPVLLADEGKHKFIGWCRRIVRLARLIAAHEIDVVHACCPVSEAAALIATRLARRGKVLGIRRNIGYWHTPWTLRRARLVRFLGAHYVANCEAAREFAVAAERIPRQRISVIHNPVSMARRDDGLAQVADRGELGIGNGGPVVGMVATIRPIKDHATFLRAAGLVLQRFPATTFLAVGSSEPEHLGSLQALGDELEITPHVRWLGAVENPFSLLPHLDVGVLSSLSEGFSNALLEYAAAGVPAVATDVGGTREVIQDGVTGFLVPPRSPELLADRICRLLEDRTLREAFGMRAAERADALFSQQRVLDQYVQLYYRLAGRGDVPAEQCLAPTAQTMP